MLINNFYEQKWQSNEKKVFEMYIKNLGPFENAVQELAEGFLPV